MAADKPISNSSGSTLLKSALGVVAGLAIFAVILPLAYRGGKPSAPVKDAADALPTAAELRAKDEEILNSYGWVDREKGIVRLPINRARELFIEEVNP